MGYGGDTPARRSISSQIGQGQWASRCDVFVARGGSDSGDWDDNRGQGWQRGKGKSNYIGRLGVPPAALTRLTYRRCQVSPSSIFPQANRVRKRLKGTFIIATPDSPWQLPTS